MACFQYLLGSAQVIVSQILHDWLVLLLYEVFLEVFHQGQ